MKAKKLSSLLKKKVLKSPKTRIKSISPEKVLSKGLPRHASLVREGRMGYLNDEYEKETKWLS